MENKIEKEQIYMPSYFELRRLDQALNWNFGKRKAKSKTKSFVRKTYPTTDKLS